MDFDFSDDQRLLKDSVARFVAERYGFEDRTRMLAMPGGRDPAIWSAMAELGLLGLPFAEADGGFGGGGTETMILMEEFGRGLVVEPYLSAIVLAGTILGDAASGDQRAARIERIVAGDHRLAVAFAEPRGPRYAVDARATVAVGDRLTGEKIAVLGGGDAHELIVSARTSTGETGLFFVDAAAPGVSVHAEAGYDGSRVATVRLDDVPAERIAGDGAAHLTRAIEAANAALCAEAVGAMAAALDLTTEYLKTRKQFGVPIASFQALQHRAVDMLMQLELARSMAIFAAVSLDQPPAVRAANIAAAKVQVARAARFVGQQAVQLHGGIGITAEYKIGHVFKRLTAIETLFGDADHHLDALTDIGGLAA
ncbi:acyl-CoA dehydrogenase family protein [Sphingomonas montana]|uniref:acyl-CoA dehydrogenase family protein n=1 Tax=Sphingomonas montana TaxID=1843236 RepID=UPI00096CDF11|nr:acyl-CoA dehydrogenase [Sphingomonas montana]